MNEEMAKKKSSSRRETWAAVLELKAACLACVEAVGLPLIETFHGCPNAAIDATIKPAVQKEAVLVHHDNRGKFDPEKAQEAHLDAAIDAADPRNGVAITATDELDMLLALRSAPYVREWYLLGEGYLRNAARDEFLVSHGAPPFVRQRLQAGDMLIMLGSMVHGGAPGERGKPAPRLHCYMQCENVTDTTQPIVMFEGVESAFNRAAG